ncbi:MAG: thioesterase family protein [Candidatus Omnitrophica bacterium]|nr:thioesterase family protein [Candidatus Omnitrophota bacterium]MDD5237856.1 thioesterase family protein [Candidatus Omnitrophota bacterium]
MKVKIYYHHTDCGGVVYYANYLKFLEEARTEFLAQRGISIGELAKEGTLFVVSRQEIDYKLPAFYGDTLEIDTRISDISPVRLIFDCEIKNQNKQAVAKAKTILVCVDKTLRPKAIPKGIQEIIS